MDDDRVGQQADQFDGLAERRLAEAQRVEDDVVLVDGHLDECDERGVAALAILLDVERDDSAVEAVGMLGHPVTEVFVAFEKAKGAVDHGKFLLSGARAF